MAAIVNEVAREQEGSFTANGWEPTRVWNVTVDSVVSAARAAVEAVRAQETDIGDAHPLHPFNFLKRLTPTGTDNRKIWNVTGQYEQLSGSVGRTANPLEEPPVVLWGTSKEEAPIVSAYNEEGERKVPVVNSAGQPFDPPLTEPRNRLVATIRYNSENFNAEAANEFLEAVNDAPTIIGRVRVEERMAKIIEFTGEPQEFEGTNYSTITIKVELNTNVTLAVVDDETVIVAQGWDREVLDQGLFELKDGALPEDPKLIVRMRTDDGEEVTEPLKLDGEGKKLDPQNADPVFLTFRTNKKKSFVGLNLEVTEPFRPTIRLA